MKHTIAIRMLGLFVAVLCVKAWDPLLAQTDYNVPLTFGVTQTGVNRYVTGQWNESGFTKSWSGTYQGLSYSIVLNKPYIVLLENNIKINLSLIINATEGSITIFDDDVTISPTLTIPPTSLSLSNVIGEYLDLRQQIDSTAGLIDTRLRDVIDQVLAPIDWIIYKGKVLDASTQQLVDYADIRLKSLPTLAFAVVNGEIQFTITQTITAQEPYYVLQTRNVNGKLLFRLKSNVKFRSQNWKFTTTLGQCGLEVTNSNYATIDPIDGLYYLLDQTDIDAGCADVSNGLLAWYLKRNETIELVRRYGSPNNTLGESWVTWIPWAIDNGSYGY